MEIKLDDPDMPNFAKIMSVQQSIASNVFSTTARVNDSNLRRTQTDKLDELLNLIRDEDRQNDQLPYEPPQEGGEYGGSDEGARLSHETNEVPCEGFEEGEGPAEAASEEAASALTLADLLGD